MKVRHQLTFSTQQLDILIKSLDVFREVRQDEIQTITDWMPTFRKGIINHFKQSQLAILAEEEALLNEVAEKLDRTRDTAVSPSSLLPVGDFSLALTMLKAGYAVRRVGWSRPGMFLELIDPHHNEEYAIEEKPQISGTLMRHILMHTADNELIPWVASQSCLLANDWEVYFTGKDIGQPPKEQAVSGETD